MREDNFLVPANLFKLLHFEWVIDSHGNEVQLTCLFSVIVSTINVFQKKSTFSFHATYLK